MKIQLAVILCAGIISSSMFGKEGSSYRDHAHVHEDYIQAASTFTDNNFKSKNTFDVIKIESFLNRLRREREQTAKDLYETQIIETLELEVRKFKKAAKNADKERESSGIIAGYDQFLIPQIEKLLAKAKKDPRCASCQALVDEFIRGYNPYFMPNAHRSIFPMDVDVDYAVKRILKPYKFYRNNPKSLEANNLVVGSHAKLLESCLKRKLYPKEYLTHSDLETLKNDCNFDLSYIDPGVSALWSPLSREERKRIHEEDMTYFPKPEEPVFFKKITFRGQGSAKLKVTFLRDGVERKVKLKAGREIHTDKAVSKIMELMGMNQDRMIYRDQVKVYLRDLSYSEFLSMYANKYGVAAAKRFIWAHGGEKGDEWVIMKDVIFEARRDDEVRVMPMDFSSWDLRNRREYRGLLLAWGWLGINDTKLANFKLIFHKNEDGSFTPLHRLQDTGVALGTPSTAKRPKDFIQLFNYYKVNAFREHFLKYKNGKIRIYWNDFANRKRMFDTTTWFDLKWQARRIAEISSEDILRALRDSGMPEPVAEMYWHKLRSRRNDIVKMFDLDLDYSLFEIPEIKKYTPDPDNGNGSIKKGKVVKTVFKGKNDVVQVQEQWMTFLPKLLSFSIPVSEWTDKYSGIRMGTALEGLNGLKKGLNMENIPNSQATSFLQLGLGVSAVLTRQVRSNANLINLNGKNHLYKITDKMEIIVGVDSPLLRSLIRKVPVINADASIKFYKKEFSFIHFDDNVKHAYLKPFRISKIFKNPKKYAAFKLEPMEVMKSYHSYGMEMEGGASVSIQKPFLGNEFSFTGGVSKQVMDYFLRDEFGQLHFYHDKSRRRAGGMHLSLIEANALAAKVALAKVSVGKSKVSHDETDYIFKLGSDRDGVMDLLTEEQRQKEYDALLSLENIKSKDAASSEEGFEKNFEISSEYSFKHKAFSGLFFLNSESNTHEATTSVTLPGGEARRFYKRGYTKSRSVGVEKPVIDYGESDVLVRNRRRTEVAIELDQDNTGDFVAVIRTEDFFRYKTPENLKQILIDLNRRYAETKDGAFYRIENLPTDTVAKYRKIYSRTRTFIKGSKLLNELKNVSSDDLEEMADSHFRIRNPNVNKLRLAKKKFGKKRLINKLVRRFRKLKIAANHGMDSEPALISRALQKFLVGLRTEMFGVRILKELGGEKSLFVMGDISGILRSFSCLQDLQQAQRRRFTGSSWGHYKVVPPIQKFLRFKRIVPPSMLVERGANDLQMFGKLEIGTAPNIGGVFDRNGDF